MPASVSCVMRRRLLKHLLGWLGVGVGYGAGCGWWWRAARGGAELRRIESVPRAFAHSFQLILHSSMPNRHSLC